MQLGIVITDETTVEEARCLLEAALDRGWQCRCFLTDRGVRVLESASFRDLARTGRVRIDVCELSWERLGQGALPENVTAGSQYQNAELAHSCHKVVVL